jgi:hypothetical protein
MLRPRRDLPGSTPLTPSNPGIDPSPTPVFDPAAQRDAARAAADHAARCHYVKPSGERCGSPAMRGLELCYYHDRYQPKPGYRNLPCLEDPHSVQCAIQEIIEDMLNGLLDYKKAALALYGLQTAASNLKQMRTAQEKKPETTQQARGLSESFGGDRLQPIRVSAKETPAPAAEVRLSPRPTTNDQQPTTGFVESPRQPQHVTYGLTAAERQRMNEVFPDMKKIRAEFLASLTPEERTRMETPEARG